ncbi:hypothetical protein [Apilactobacillus micheneri]|uniref:hypothetical protein n=1 Tax=Apilactobacillus micheneri TaxID=1899430 RepID=UPI0015E836A9|nr:hypothetical protein [Apilactobacillus micheneri]
MKIDKQRLILKTLLIYLPFMLCLASLELFNNFILFILIYIFLMAFMAIMFLFKKGVLK